MRGRRAPSHEGAYSGPRAAKIAGVSYRRLDYWARKGFIRPTIQSSHGSGNYRLYSVLDILALRVAKRLRDQGVSLRTIRRAVHALRQAGPAYQDPLTQYTFFVRGKRLYVLTDDPARALEASQGAQLVLAVTLEGLAGPEGARSVKETSPKPTRELLNLSLKL